MASGKIPDESRMANGPGFGPDHLKELGRLAPPSEADQIEAKIPEEVSGSAAGYLGPYGLRETHYVTLLVVGENGSIRQMKLGEIIDPRFLP